MKQRMRASEKQRRDWHEAGPSHREGFHGPAASQSSHQPARETDLLGLGGPLTPAAAGVDQLSPAPLVSLG